MQNKLAHSAKTGDAKAVQCKCFVACVSLLTYLLTDQRFRCPGSPGFP